MPRRRRVFVGGGVYHLYNRFARGEVLFADHEEAIEFLEMTAKPLAGLVGRLPEAVSRWESRDAEMRQESEDLREAYEKLDRDLARRYKTRK